MKKKSVCSLAVVFGILSLSTFAAATGQTPTTVGAGSMQSTIITDGVFQIGEKHLTPVVMLVTGPLQRPNEVKDDRFTGCALFGEGYGDLGTGKVTIKLSSVVCDDGPKGPVKGFVEGSDGYAGVNGEISPAVKYDVVAAAVAKDIPADKQVSNVALTSFPVVKVPTGTKVTAWIIKP